MFDKAMFENMLRQTAASGDTMAKQQVETAMQEMQKGLSQMEAMKNMPGMGEVINDMQDIQNLYLELFKSGGQQAKSPAASTAQRTANRSLKWVDDNHVEFGSYAQTVNGGILPILWRVLENKDGQVLLLSEYILDARYWHDKVSYDIPVTWKKDDILKAMIPWEKCDLRKWLNSEFYDTAFTPAEKNMIAERHNSGNGAYLHHDYVPKKMNRMNANILTTDTYETYEERGCQDTKDRVFLLSIEEAIAFFGASDTVPNTKWSANLDRLAKPTEFLINRGTFDPEKNTYHKLTVNKAGYWAGKDWVDVHELSGSIGYYLRSAGSNDVAMHGQKVSSHHGQLSCVTTLGSINAAGLLPNILSIGVRPAILIHA